MNLDQLNSISKAHKMNEKRKQILNKHATKGKVGAFFLISALAVVLVKKLREKKTNNNV